jgi:hypothetical protein
MATLKYSNVQTLLYFGHAELFLGQWYNPITQRFDFSRGYTWWQFMIAEIQYGPPIQ